MSLNERWLSLHKRNRQHGKLCQVSTSARGAPNILRDLGGWGVLVVIIEALTPEEGQALLKEIILLEQSR